MLTTCDGGRISKREGRCLSLHHAGTGHRCNHNTEQAGTGGSA
jgi:hypothetical protein